MKYFMLCLVIFIGCSVPALPTTPNELKEEIAALQVEVQHCKDDLVVAEKILDKAYENEKVAPWHTNSYVVSASNRLRWAQYDLEKAEKRLARAKQRLENIKE